MTFLHKYGLSIIKIKINGLEKVKGLSKGYLEIASAKFSNWILKAILLKR